MSKTKYGMEALPGFPTDQRLYDGESYSDDDIEKLYPGIRDVFDNILLLNKAPRDIREDIYNGRTEFPFEAAIAVPDEAGRLKIVSRSRNRTKGQTGSLGHAELLATEQALAILETKHLPENAVLLSTAEPCSMCAGGLIHAGGHQVVFGVSQSDFRGERTWVNGQSKAFRTEPDDYSARDFMLARDPSAAVIGGYRQHEVLEYML